MRLVVPFKICFSSLGNVFYFIILNVHSVMQCYVSDFDYCNPLYLKCPGEGGHFVNKTSKIKKKKFFKKRKLLNEFETIWPLINLKKYFTNIGNKAIWFVIVKNIWSFTQIHHKWRFIQYSAELHLFKH